MENTKNISSDEELLKLHNEGKITEDEYEELFLEIRKNPAETAKNEKISESDSKQKMVITSLVLSISGIFLPLLFYSFLNALIAKNNWKLAIAPWFFLGLTIELAALVLGIISWRTDYGKAGTIISVLVIVFVFLLMT